MNNLNYHVSDDDYSYYGFNLNEFQQEHGDVNFYVNQIEYDYKGPQASAEVEIAEKIAAFGLKYRIRHIENNALYINFYNDHGHRVLMIFTRIGRRPNFDGNIFGESSGTFVLRISGVAPYIEKATEALKQPPVHQATMKWYFKHDGRTDYRVIDIEQKHPVMDEMYPWIEGGVHEYFKKYLASEANILLLLGDPGTGKTTFIRELIVRNNLKGMITYEEELMNTDRIFLDLIVDEQDILIMEDADLMLLSRESSGNKVMSKLLNISDGLMKNKKKIVFTGNINYNSISKTDHALIRPGRCFDVLNFRDLTYNEAEKAAKAMNIPMPEQHFKEISLAKLTNPDYKPPEVSSIGFT